MSTTFTKVTQTYDATDGTMTASASSVVGSAIQLSKGDLQLYAALGLKVETTRTLFFTPDTYGQVPVMGMTVVWGGVTLTVKHVQEIAPDGVTIAARVVVAK